MATLAARNRRLAAICGGVALGMVGLAYASVPLYELFCRVTGYGGTTQRAEAAPGGAAGSGRVVTVRFDANVAPGLSWSFKAEQPSLSLRVGEERLGFFRAENIGPVPVVGTATYAVTPHKAGIYFAKVQCFCFTEQVLKPGEVIDMPVSFFVDPAIEDDRNLDDVRTITLSYTFHRAPDQKAAAARTSALAPAPQTLN